MKKIIAHLCQKNLIVMKIVTKMACFYWNTPVVFDGATATFNGWKISSIKRSLYYLRGMEYRSKKLRKEYFFDTVVEDLEVGGVIVDCGANSGDFLYEMKDFIVHAFEPGKAEFDALSSNLENQSNINLHNKGLSDTTGVTRLFINAGDGDNSIVDFPTSEGFIDIETIRLDEVITSKDIQFLKVEAEGWEPEVLLGSASILPRIKYICVDCGFERGGDQTTLPAVTNYLLKNNFELLDAGQTRMCLLFKNRSMV